MNYIYLTLGLSLITGLYAFIARKEKILILSWSISTLLSFQIHNYSTWDIYHQKENSDISIAQFDLIQYSKTNLLATIDAIKIGNPDIICFINCKEPAYSNLFSKLSSKYPYLKSTKSTQDRYQILISKSPLANLSLDNFTLHDGDFFLKSTANSTPLYLIGISNKKDLNYQIYLNDYLCNQDKPFVIFNSFKNSCNLNDLVKQSEILDQFSVNYSNHFDFKNLSYLTTYQNENLGLFLTLEVNNNKDLELVQIY